jgi:hypothetical protein
MSPTCDQSNQEQHFQCRKNWKKRCINDAYNYQIHDHRSAIWNATKTHLTSHQILQPELKYIDSDETDESAISF